MAKGEIVPARPADADVVVDQDDDDAPATVPAKAGKAGVPAGRSPPAARAEPRFFSIYKKGQGKWTRLGTVFAAIALGLLTTYNLYQYVLPYLPIDDVNVPADHRYEHARTLLFVGCTAFLVAFALLTFWLVNKPKNVDFLIATDSEMKKVNWTTKGELLGSTRVVVLFLIFIALFLFAVDLIFQQFFHLIRVLQG